MGAGCGEAVGNKGILSHLPAPTLPCLPSCQIAPFTDAAPVAEHTLAYTVAVFDAVAYSLGVGLAGAHPPLTDGNSDAEYRLKSCRDDTNTSVFLDESATENCNIMKSAH